MTGPRQVYHLALRDLHAAAGAQFHVRCDWSLPAHYGDPRAEHTAIRKAAAITDRSHRSRIMVTGADAQAVLAAVFAGHLGELDEGRAMRTVSLDAASHVRDVVLVARTGGIAYLVCGEPGQRFDTLARLHAAALPDYDIRVDDRTETTCMIGLAGPQAERIAREHLSESLPARLQPLHCATFELHGFRALAVRTSDTGEDGFEFTLAPAVAQHVIETLRSAGVPMAGDTAQETARVEACIPAWEPDLEGGLTPAEAGLDVLLDIPGGHAGRLLSALLVETAEPVACGATALAPAEVAGVVRSCVRSFSLDATIALAVIDQRYASPGTELSVAGCRAAVVTKPFLRRRL